MWIVIAALLLFSSGTLSATPDAQNCRDNIDKIHREKLIRTELVQLGDVKLPSSEAAVRHVQRSVVEQQELGTLACVALAFDIGNYGRPKNVRVIYAYPRYA